MDAKQAATNEEILKQLEWARGMMIEANGMKCNGSRVGRLNATVRMLTDRIESLVTRRTSRFASLCTKCWLTTMHDADALSFLCDSCEEKDLQRRVDERKADSASASECTCFDKTCAVCVSFKSEAYHASPMCVHNVDVKCLDEFCF